MNRLIDLFYFGKHGMFILPEAWNTLHLLAQGYLSNPNQFAGAAAVQERLDVVAPARPQSASAFYVGGHSAGAHHLEKEMERHGIGYIFATGTVAKRITVDLCAPEQFLDLVHVDKALRRLAADDDISSILIHLDTPGGYGLGLQGTCDLITEISKEKPVYTYTDTVQASAGIWAFCSASEKYCSADASVGSIGSYMVLFNQLRQYQEAGIDVEFMRSGEFKGAGHPLKELTEAELEMFRDRLEMHAEKFRACVEEHTDLTREHMEGEVFEGAEAVDLGLMDAVVSSPEEMVAMIAEAHAAA